MHQQWGKRVIYQIPIVSGIHQGCALAFVLGHIVDSIQAAQAGW